MEGCVLNLSGQDKDKAQAGVNKVMKISVS
jgi:hypothetical protein